MGRAIVGGIALSGLLGLVIVLLGPAPTRDEASAPSGRDVDGASDAGGASFASTASVKRVSGQVWNGSTGRPISGARVTWLRVADDGARTEGESTDSGVDGRYGLEVTGAGFLAVAADGFQPRVELDLDGPRATLRHITLQPGRRVRGRVLLPGGRPATGGKIVVVSEGELGSGWWPTAIRADGTFEEFVPFDRVSLQVWADGYAPVRSRVLPMGRAPVDDFEVIARPGRRLRGRVLHSDGEPVVGAGVYVWVQRWSGDPAGLFLDPSASTDGEGRFELQGLPLDDDVSLMVSHHDVPPYQVHESSIERPESGDLSIRIPRGQSLVFSASEVEGTSPHLWTWPGLSTVTVERRPDGRYQSHAFATTENIATLFVHGHRARPLSWVPATGVVDLGAVELEPAARHRIRVIDAEGQPCAGVSVAVVGVSTELSAFSTRVTDDEGVAVIHGLREGAELGIEITDGRRRRMVEPFTPMGATSEFVLDEPAQQLYFEGFVTEEGRPLAARVRLTSEPRRYSFSGPAGWNPSDVCQHVPLVPVGVPLEFEVTAKGYRPSRVSVSPLEAGEFRSLPPVRLERDRSVRIDVLDGHGFPLEGVEVSAESNRSARTNGWGVAHIEPAAADGELRLERLGYETRVEAIPPSRRIVVSLERLPHRTVSGRFVFDDGEPVRGAALDIELASDADSDSGRAHVSFDRCVTHHDGSFALEVPIGRMGRVRVTSQNPKHDTTISLSDLEAKSLQRLPRGRTLRAALFDARLGSAFSGEVVVVVQDADLREVGRIFAPSSRLPRSTFEFHQLPPGPLVVHVESDGFEVEPVTVPDTGSPAEVRVDLETVAFVVDFEVLVADERGQPVRDALVRLVPTSRHVAAMWTSEQVAGSVRTDADGIARVAGRRGQEYVIQVDYRGERTSAIAEAATGIRVSVEVRRGR